MAEIVIVGLGPGKAEQITVEAWHTLQKARRVYLRTQRHPGFDALPSGPEYITFDQVYEQHDRFEDVYEDIAGRVLAAAKFDGCTIYAVPGHPTMGETSVCRIIQLAKDDGVAVRIVAGLSFLEPTTLALGVDPFDGLQICDALELAGRHHPPLNPDVGALVVQLYSRLVAADVKMTLMNLYHDGHPVRLVIGAGTPEERVRDLSLYEIDRQTDLDHLTSLYIPPLAQQGSLESYQDIVARLRAPGGCPWDREQTHRTLRRYLLEETYEVLEALDADDREALKAELGESSPSGFPAWPDCLRGGGF